MQQQGVDCSLKNVHICCREMISQADLKRFASLGQTKYRQKYAQFLVEGRKAVEEVFHSKLEIDTILATSAFIERFPMPFNVEIIPAKDMERISQFTTPPGVIAVVNKPEYDVPQEFSKFNIYLDGVSDPGNLGAIMRIADWYGIDTLWLSEDCVDETNPKVIASSMGSFIRIKCLRSTAIFKHNLEVLGADLEGISVYNLPQTRETQQVLVMGSESHGIRPEIAQLLTKKVNIPRIGGAESLNVAVSAGILVDRLLHP